jgi:hypothetical protein
MGIQGRVEMVEQRHGGGLGTVARVTIRIAITTPVCDP